MGHVSILLDKMGLDKMGLDEMGINHICVFVEARGPGGMIPQEKNLGI